MKKPKTITEYIQKCVGCGKKFSTTRKNKKFDSYLCSRKYRKSQEYKLMKQIRKLKKPNPIEDYRQRVSKEIDRLRDMIQ